MKVLISKFQLNTYLSAFIVLVGLQILNVQAQQIRHLGLAEGLNGRQAFNFVQDKDGFIWISTKYGVDRFDGKNVKNYTFDILNRVKNPLREVHILCDKDSALWAYTDNGMINYYDTRNDRFVNYVNLKSYLKTVFIDDQNIIWIGVNNALGKISNGKITILKHRKLDFKMVRKILPYKDNKLIVVTTNSVLLYNTKNNTISEFNTEIAKSVLSFQIETAYYDARNLQLWLGTSNSGIVLFDLRTKKLISNIVESLASSPVFSIYPVDNEHIFVGTDGMGAVLLNKKLLKVEKFYAQQENNLYGLIGNEIYDIFKDKEGRLWMSTYSDGVNIIESKKEGFSVLRHERNNPNSLITKVVRCIMIDASQNVWFGSNNGITIWNKNNNTWKRILLSKNVMTIFEDSKQNIWVGTYASGVFLLDKNGSLKKHFYKKNDQTNTIGTNFVYKIFEDVNNNIWLGGIKGPLSKYDSKLNSFKQIQLYQINNIIQHNNNELLIATTNGIHRLWLNDDTHKTWAYADSLKSLCVHDMLLDSDSMLWITSYGGGLSLCNLNNGKIQHFTQKNGLSSDIMYSILEDDKNNLWITGENGLSKMNLQTKSIVNFTTGDGISDMSFRPLSRAKAASGELFFGSYNGVTYFKPQDIEPTVSMSKLVFTDFSLFNRIMQPNDKNSPLTDKINNLKEIHLSYRDHSFSLNFGTINFAPNAKRRYLWKLEGLDKDWVGSSTETVVNYTNLTPQTYIFKIKSIGDNNAVLDERALKVVIHPPFWNTLPAKIIAFILLVMFAYWAYKYLSNLYEKRRTTEKIKFFINTTHDLRTPLTLISSPIYELKEKLVLDEWNKYLLDLVTSNLEKMNKMVSQLLDFQKSYESEEHLMVTKNNLNAMLTEKKMFWEPVAQRKNITLQLHLPENPLFEWYDRQKMDKITDNLISNAIKYSRNDGTVEIGLSFTSSHWQINVSDNGIGIPESAARKLFKRFYRAENAINSQETGSGLGLLLIKNYVSLHKGQTGVTSSENKGSDFLIRLKRGNKHYRQSELIDETEFAKSQFEASNIEIEKLDKIKTKLLIVEDNPDLREYINMSLSHYFTTYTAENGKDAWEKIPTINPDIVLSDYNMPEMNGFELCEKIKKTYETSHIPVILLTVMSDIKNMEEGYKLGADDYIPKPFDVKYLKLKIDNIISNRKILRNKFLEINKPIEIAETAENEHNVAFLSKALQIVEDHMIDTDFSITDFSREMGMSKSLLYTKFHAITGYSPNDFVKIIRMKKAVSLFKEGSFNINEVAVMTGFDEASYFTTCFKKIYGKSPKQFIKENFGKNE